LLFYKSTNIIRTAELYKQYNNEVNNLKKALVIVESPAKVKTIKKFLSKDYAVEASMGHIRDLPKSQLGIDLENDFEPKYITIRGKSEITNRLKKEAKNAEIIYLATDPDREGEAISWHLSKLLGLDEKKVRRVVFNEITKTAVTTAIKNPRDLDMDLVDAQQARRILDRLVGYKISPLLWKKVKKGLSAGRVQSVAVRLICDRENEIRSFIVKEYWSLISKLSKINGKKIFDARFFGVAGEKLEINDEASMNKLLKDLDKAEYKVSKIKKGEKRRSSPLSFTTSTMQQEAYKKLGFTTKKTMMLAQQLYEGIDIKGEGTVGLVTYIRTDSVRISDEAKAEAEIYIKDKYGAEYLSNGNKAQKTGKKIQDAHEAIRPSSINRDPEIIKASLEKDQFRLYEMIWERFVASQMASAIYDTVNIDIIAKKSKKEFIFKAAGSLLKFAGFLKVYSDGKEDKEEFNDITIPDLSEGEVLSLKELEPKQHFTEPPARFTEATLVKILEEKGIGRPSTYSPIISTIQDRGYVVKEKKFFIPTDLGEKVTDLMREYFSKIVNVEFTADMEKTLDEIAEGNVPWKNMIREFYTPFAVTLEAAEQIIGKIEIKDEESEVVCELCGRLLVFKQGKFGKFLACPGFPECRNTKAIVKKLDIKCPKCETGELIERTTKRGKKFFGCNTYPTCDFVSWDEPINENCPECGTILYKKYVKGKYIKKCNKEGCGYIGTEL